MIETSKKFITRKKEQFQKELKNGKPIGMKDIGRKGKHFFTREAWTFLQQYNLPEKVFLIERLRKHGYSGELAHMNFWKKDEVEYRIGYYIVGKIGHAKGRWICGQFCPFIPEKDFVKLMEKAHEEKTII